MPAGTEHPASRLPHLRELDGVRGLAALAVFLHHLCFVQIHNPARWIWPIRALHAAARYGSAGVDFFFVLSGFLITQLLLRDRASPAFFHDFYWKRALRILPLYVLVLVWVFFALPHSHPYVLLSAFFLANFAEVFKVAAPGPFWSLAIEEQFYLVWPSVVRRCPPAVLARWAGAVWIAVVVLRFALAPTGHFNYYLTPLRLDGLAAGALLACRYQQPHRRSHPRLLTLAAMAGLVVAFLSTRLGPARSPAFAAALLQSAIVLLAAACIALVIDHAGSPWLAWLRSAPLLFYGAISYALYMTHIYVLEAWNHLFGFPAQGSTSAYFTRLLGVLAATTLLCLVTRYAIELPAISLRRKVLARPAPLPETALPLLTPSTPSQREL